MSSFGYKITSKKDVTVVSFTGKIDKDSKSLIDACRNQVFKERPSLVVIYFKDIESIDATILRDITLFQHEIRKKRIELYIAGLDNNMREFLLERAVIRISEYKKTLLDVFEQKLKSS